MPVRARAGTESTIPSIAIIGAGSVGLNLGARLSRSGVDVLFVVRRAESARAIEHQGVSVGDPASGEVWSADIASDKWLKLCVNLTSAPNALIARADHRDPRFAEIKALLVEEARDALRAAGIRAASCDGRDRSLDEEIAHIRGSVASGESFRALPLFNAVWGALSRPGKSLEVDLYHQRIIGLGCTHGVATPSHERVLEALLRAHQLRLGPECLRVDELVVQ